MNEYYYESLENALGRIENAHPYAEAIEIAHDAVVDRPRGRTAFRLSDISAYEALKQESYSSRAPWIPAFEDFV